MRLILIILGLLILLVLIFIFAESSRECKKLNITRYQITNSKIPKEFNGCKFMVLADYHNSEFPNHNEKMFSLIHESNPDFFVIAGDMVVCRRKYDEANVKTAGLLHELEKIAPVYYGYGNHEQGLIECTHDTDGLWNHYFDEADFKHHESLYCMNNESIEITRQNASIRITGIGLAKEYFKRCSKQKLTTEEIETLVGKASADEYQILIAHSPDYFKTYSEWGADLVLSGHNHGGLIRIPLLGGVISPRLTLFPKYDAGKFVSKNKKSVMLLSRGLGAHSIKIRVFNKPELILVELNA